jgi:hypothetical protein
MRYQRYQVCPIGHAYWCDPERQYDPGLHEPVYSTDDREEAERFAGDQATGHEFGLAIADLETGEVDYGDWSRKFEILQLLPALNIVSPAQWYSVDLVISDMRLFVYRLREREEIAGAWGYRIYQILPSGAWRLRIEGVARSPEEAEIRGSMEAAKLKAEEAK